MKFIFTGSFLLLILLIIYYGPLGSAEIKTDVINENFGGYWYQGTAEMSRYQLSQVRYGEVHEGDAVLIFVTEDFLPETQVKYEYAPTSEKPVKILKLNATRKFYTGIYPYSTMISVFTPIQNPKTLKVTTTIQEWCGHTFMQLNLRNAKYTGNLHSYFQKEGDQSFTLKNVLLEDEIWTRIRLNPQDLPTGEIEIIPGTIHQRFAHIDPQVQQAEASLSMNSGQLSKYSVAYKNGNRILTIQFQSEFPYQIEEWEEIHRQENDQTLTTTAKKTHSIMLDYWNHNSVEDRNLLPELGLN